MAVRSVPRARWWVGAGLLVLGAAAAVAGFVSLVGDDEDPPADDGSRLQQPRLAAGADPTWSVDLAGEYPGSAVATDDLVLVAEWQEGGDRSFVALGRDDGTERWRYEFPRGESPQPIFEAHAIDPTVTVLAASRSENTWHGLDPSSGEPVWDLTETDDVRYLPLGGRLIRVSDEGLAVVDPLDGRVAWTVGDPGNEARFADGRVNAGTATSIDLYDSISFEPIVGPVDVGRPIGVATESGELLFALDPEGTTLFAFDADGTELDSLELDGPGTRRTLLDVSDGEPKVLVGEREDDSVIALVDGTLTRVGANPAAGGELRRVDGHSYELVDVAEAPYSIVALPSGETTIAFPAGTTPFALGDGLVVADCPDPDVGDSCTFEAYGFDGDLRWRLPVASALGLSNPTFVEGGTLTVVPREDGGDTVSFHE